MQLDVRVVSPDSHDLSASFNWFDLRENQQGRQGNLTESKSKLEALVAARTERLQSTVNELKLELSKLRESEAQMHRLAHFDDLTGLPNRLLLKDRCRCALTSATRLGKSLTLMLLDVDHFKSINDSLGHNTGDKVLIELGERLNSSLREQDTIARLGGDEFVLLLPETDANGASRVAEKLLLALVKPFLVESQALDITLSIGIAVFPQDGSSLEELSKRADAAMYKAKVGGRNSYRSYTKTVDS